MTAKRRTVVALALAVLGLLAPAAATATPSVKGPPAAPHTHVVPGDLSGLSCATPSVCFAISIGATKARFGVLRITDHGASTHLSRINANYYLDSLSCPSSAGCALLDYGPPTYRPQLVRVGLDGTLGKPRYLGPSGSDLDVGALDCYPTREHCTVVGHGKQVLRVLTVKGAKTSRHVLTVPTDVVIGSIDDVACPTASQCYAVGQATVNSKTVDQGFVVPIRNGRPQPPIYLPEGSAGGGLIGIACASARRCYAIGDAFSAQSGVSVVETLVNGSRTHSVSMPVLVDLEGVACRNSQLCYVVGSDGHLGAIFPLHDGKLGKEQTTSVTKAYGTTLNSHPIATFAGGIELLGLDHMKVFQTVVSSS